MNRKNLLVIGSLPLLVCLVAVSANADPNFEVRSVSADFERHDSGVQLGIGQFKNHQSSQTHSAFQGKGSGIGEIAGMTFSFISAPPDCQLDVSSGTTPSTSAPEPATMLLLGTGLAGIAGLMRRQRRMRRKLAE